MSTESTTPEATVTISLERYNELLKSEDKLTALEDGGVDNWDWYDESLRDFYKKYSDDQ